MQCINLCMYCMFMYVLCGSVFIWFVFLSFFFTPCEFIDSRSKYSLVIALYAILYWEGKSAQGWLKNAFLIFVWHFCTTKLKVNSPLLITSIVSSIIHYQYIYYVQPITKLMMIFLYNISYEWTGIHVMDLLVHTNCAHEMRVKWNASINRTLTVPKHLCLYTEIMTAH